MPKSAPASYRKKNNNELYADLKSFRLQFSRSENVKAYYIFTNEVLEALIDQRPADIHELLNVFGMGVWKAEWFGHEVIDIVNEEVRMV